MQVNSCLTYADKELFGTFNPESEQYDYITYEEYGRRVNDCRAVLKDLGKLLIHNNIVRRCFSV